jgi:hypothetical protein
MPETPEEIALREKALEFNQNNRFSPPLAPPTTPQDSLDTALSSATSVVKYSDSGAGGAILVMPSQDLPKGAAIKVESTSSVKTAEKCSQVMDNFFSNATGPSPFAAPRIKVYRKEDFEADPNLQAQLAGKFDNLQHDANVQGRWGFQTAKKNVDKVTTGETAVLMMEFAEGTQLNKLPTQEKAALMRSEAFAQSMGRAMAPTIALGLTDHAGTQDGVGYKANISNFMYSPKTGTLSVIDYDSGGRPVDPNKPNGDIRVGQADAASNLKDMRTFLEKASQSPEAFDQAVNDMINPKVSTPFSPLMQSFTEHSYDGMFGKTTKPPGADMKALENFSAEERKNFAANLLIGAVDGLEYMQKNQQALENAVTQSYDVDENGQTVEHFHTQQEMADLRQELSQVDAQTLKTNMGQYMDARNLKEHNSLATYVDDLNKKIQDAQGRLEAANAKIDHLRSHPSTGERLKSAFSTKGHSPLDKALAEKDKALKDLQFATDLRDMAQSKLNYSDQMHLQSKLPPVPQRPAPPLPGNNVNNVGLDNSGQQQIPPSPKPHVRDLLYGSHDDHGHGQNQSTGSKLSLSGHRTPRDSQEGLDGSQGTGKDVEKGLKTGEKEKSPKLNDSSGHHSVGGDNPDLVKHLSQSRNQSHEQSQGPHVK